MSDQAAVPKLLSERMRKLTAQWSAFDVSQPLEVMTGEVAKLESELEAERKMRQEAEAQERECLNYIQTDANVQIDEAESALIACGLEDWETLATGIQAVQQERDQLKAALAQVEEVLVVNWIDVKDGNYKQALADLVTFNIQIHDDPRVSQTAAEHQQIKEERDRLKERVQKLEKALRAARIRRP